MRYARIDVLRGLAVLGMVCYHFCYDWFVVFGRNPFWFQHGAVVLWQQAVCWTFILLSGFVWYWGRRGALRRGLICSLCGLAVTLVTALAVPEEAVWFGVLSFYGCAIWLLLPLEPLLRRVPGWPGLGIGFVLFVLTRRVAEGVVSLGSLTLWHIPRNVYQSGWLMPLGFPAPGFRSSDYFPLLPWFFLFLCGYFLFRISRERESWQRLLKGTAPEGLARIGRHSLLIYMLHQPLCMGLCWLLKNV